ncbi:MAG: hypothetical protein FD145_719 [Candidatus Saganbacteria bacterium]|uniref:Uncharacterized protein n=1 Tax=Candidatus Saganbacteria bacterium TaxID=2575572 RepID=A0A833L188_UNCSA|nr:MAG: hypothetical protein FD145_719 [Candidatus Saganbacteria bacterium]
MINAVNQSSKLMVGRADTKKVLRNFYDTMITIMNDYSDTSKPVTLFGTTYVGDQKQGIGFSLSFGQYMNNMTNAIETITNIQSFLTKLEQDVSKMG